MNLRLFLQAGARNEDRKGTACPHLPSGLWPSRKPDARKMPQSGERNKNSCSATQPAGARLMPCSISRSRGHPMYATTCQSDWRFKAGKLSLSALYHNCLVQDDDVYYVRVAHNLQTCK